MLTKKLLPPFQFVLQIKYARFTFDPTAKPVLALSEIAVLKAALQSLLNCLIVFLLY
jgi:hypothetical protein